MQFPFQITPATEDEAFMLEALKEAWKAFNAKEVPVGAVLVKNKRIIARGHNQVEQLMDATAHAEMLCITAGEAALENWRLAETTLYCTLEPCTMCAGSLYLTRIARLVYGAPDIRHGAFGSLIDFGKVKHPTHEFPIEKGVLAPYSAELMRLFFQKRRKENDE